MFPRTILKRLTDRNLYCSDNNSGARHFTIWLFKINFHGINSFNWKDSKKFKLKAKFLPRNCKRPKGLREPFYYPWAILPNEYTTM